MNRRQRKKLQRRLATATYGDASAVARLLRAGADPDTLYVAAVQGETAIVELLLQAGADPNVDTDEGTPMCAAAAWGRTDIVELLLAYGADPLLREDRGTGMTPLEWAQRVGHERIAQVLSARSSVPGTDRPAGPSA